MQFPVYCSEAMPVSNTSEIPTNKSEGAADSWQDDPYGFSGILRIDASLIFIENSFVALCLYTERKKFSKKEFWLQLFSLTTNDIFVSFTLFLWSFIKSDSFNKNIVGCAFLAVIVLVSQMAFLFNILSICVYRLMFLVCTDRFRFGWKPKTTVIQITSIYTLCLLYVIIPIAVWGNRDISIDNCSSEKLFELNGKQKAHMFIGTGLFLPLIVLNILYGVTFHLLRGHLRRKRRTGQLYRNSKQPSRSCSGQLHSIADQNTSRCDRSYCRHELADRIDHSLIQTDHGSNQPAPYLSDNACSLCRAESQTDDCCSRTGYGCNGMDCCRCREENTTDYSRSRSEPSSGRSDHSRSRTDHFLAEQSGRMLSSTDEGATSETRTTSKRSSYDNIEKSRFSIEYKPSITDRSSKLITKVRNVTALVPININISRNPHNYTLTRKGQRHVPFKGANTPTTERPSDVIDSSSRESQKQSLFLIGLILFLIDLTTVPCVVYLVAEKVFSPDSIPGFVKPLLLLLVMNNSLLNPWLYAIQSKEVRGAITHNLRKLFCRGCSR